LPSIDERQADLFASLNGKGPVLADHDLTGFFCGHTRDWSGHADGFRALLAQTIWALPCRMRIFISTITCCRGPITWRRPTALSPSRRRC
jgi:hypothetical protein